MTIWWGYGLYPDRKGDFIEKRMDQCTGAEILKEILRHLRFDKTEAIMKSSICIPCYLPYVNNIWLTMSPQRQAARGSRKVRRTSD